MNNLTYRSKMDEANEKELISILTTQLDDRRMLLNYTSELKRMLVEGYDGDVLSEKLKERGLLIEKIILSNDRYRSLRASCSLATDELKSRVGGIFQEMKHVFDATVLLDSENISFIKQCMKDITLNLEKIKDGKHFINDLRKYIGNPPSLLDVCG